MSVHLPVRETPRGLAIQLLLRRDLIIAGWHDRAILANLRNGSWVRVRRGAYVAASDWTSLDRAGQHLVLTRAVVRQSSTDVVVSHVSALPFYGVPSWGQDLAEVHVTRKDARTGRREARVRQHRGLLLEGDLETHYGIEVSSATRTALEVTTVASAEAALVVLNHLLNTGATNLKLLRARYELNMESWPSTLRTDLLLRRATDSCESVAESRFWHLCAAHHLPRPIAQFRITDAVARTSYRLDFAWPELGVFVEVDGKVKYADPHRRGESASDVLFREKQREDRIRELTGWICVRVTWADLAHPDRLIARIHRAFALAAGLSAIS